MKIFVRTMFAVSCLALATFSLTGCGGSNTKDGKMMDGKMGDGKMMDDSKMMDKKMDDGKMK